MSKKKHLPGPVPPGNRPAEGFGGNQGDPSSEQDQMAPETGNQEEDLKRRMGDFTGTADHSIQQPGGKNDSNH